MEHQTFNNWDEVQDAGALQALGAQGVSVGCYIVLMN